MSANRKTKGRFREVGLTAGLIVALFWSGRARAATIAGQWDFHADDLSATIGQSLEYLDGPSGSTAAATAFGTASSFGLPLSADRIGT